MSDNRLHRFDCDTAGMARPQQFTWPFHYVPHRLSVLAAEQVMRQVSTHHEWLNDLNAGKMLGVLVVSDSTGELGFLAAFSGILAGSNDLPYFVPPIYDLLDPDGEFKRGEREITALSHRIKALEKSPQLKQLQGEKDALITRQEKEADDFRQHCEAARERRHILRATTQLTAQDETRLIHESQFHKAELKRIRKRHAAEREAIEAKIARLTAPIEALHSQRKAMSVALQKRLFELYVVTNARSEQRPVGQIFEEYATLTGRPHLAMPPGGTGECCAPKLLQYAYDQALKPVCMAEFWWGASPTGEVRHHGHYYPACRSKCLPLLTFMLQGLDVESNPLARSSEQDITEIYDDQWITIVNKPAGMLSEPGKLLSDSALTRYKARHPEASGPVLVHRLDQETSGLLVFAKDKDTHKELQRQFAQREVHKKYVALLDGIVPGSNGVIDLPLRQNAADRPRQVVDFEKGKSAITAYEVLRHTPHGNTWVLLTPLTGRTHQLRVHASHPQGLGIPIVGDTLYGQAHERLMLHATSITFVHPVTGKQLTFNSPFDTIRIESTDKSQSSK